MKHDRATLERHLPDGVGIRPNTITKEWVVFKKAGNTTILKVKTDEVDRWKNPGRVMSYVVRRKLGIRERDS